MELELSEGDVMILLKNIAISFTSAAEAKSIDFRCSYDDQKVVTWFDHDKIEKIVTNILANAFKFTPLGGEIEFMAGYAKKPDPDGPQILEFSVKDNGPGIPENSLDKIFNRFYQVEEISGTNNIGTGIGLSLALELARLMHGDIKVWSKKDEGSIFTVTVPLGKSHLSENEFVIASREPDNNIQPELISTAYFPSGADETIAGHEDKNKAVVLIVDDNRDLRSQLFDNLEPLYNVSSAIDGVAGMKKAIEIIPDLIVTDLMMPGMDGMELCRQLKVNEITSHIPVIMLKTVVFPAPLGPMRPTICCGSITKSSLSIAVRPPNFLVRFLISNSANRATSLRLSCSDARFLAVASFSHNSLWAD